MQETAIGEQSAKAVPDANKGGAICDQKHG